MNCTWAYGWDYLEREWKELSTRTRSYSPYCEWPWIEAFRETAGDDLDVLTLAVKKGNETIALIPLQISRPANWFSPRRLVPLAAIGTFDPPSLTEEPIWRCLEGMEQESWEAAVHSAIKLVTESRFDCCQLRRLTLNKGEDVRGARGTLVFQKWKAGPNLIDLPDSWSEYRKRLSRSMRDNFAYYPKLLRRKGYDYELKVSKGDDLPVACGALIDLHRKRSANDPTGKHGNYFASEEATRMLKAGVNGLARVGMAFVGTLCIGGIAVAAQAFLESDGNLLCLYSGFDTDYANFSPLFVLQTMIFMDAVSRGLRTIDLLPGSSSWQERWGARRPLWLHRVQFFPLRAKSLTRMTLYFVRCQVTAAIRRSRIFRTDKWNPPKSFPTFLKIF